MNDFQNILNKYSNKITSENINLYSQLENTILNDDIFKSLDLDEKSIIIDILKDTINKANKKIENNDKTSINKNINKELTMSKVNSDYVFGNRNKSDYVFGNRNKVITSSTINNDNKSFNMEKKPFEFKFKTTNFTGNNVIDPLDKSEGALLSSTDKAVFIDTISEDLYLKRKAQYENLRMIESPEQRTKAWFAQRNKSITASDCGSVLGENKHEPAFNFIIKKVFGSTFATNIFCYHGKKFENVVTLMYELINDVLVSEFGLLGHPKYDFLAASPDGICAPYCRDNKTPSPLVGRMIEIKCPFQRKIKYTGDIKGEICPDYYWCQVQLQLECCDLDECDFVQCNIEEYKSRQDYLADTHEKCDYKSQKWGLERGVVIELLPAKLDETDYYEYSVKRETKDGDMYDKYNGIKNDAIYDKASFIYQPKLDMSLIELDSWIMNELDKLSLKPNVRLNKIIYWKFIERNNTLIKRDKEWFTTNIQTMRKIWAYVEILRANNKIAEEWKVWVDSLNIKYKEKIMNKLVELITNSGLWLQVVGAIGEFEPELMKQIDKMVKIPNDNELIINNLNQETPIINSSNLIINEDVGINLVECDKVELVECGKVKLVELVESNSIIQTTDLKEKCNSTVSNIEILSENFINKIVINEEEEKKEEIKEKGKKEKGKKEKVIKEKVKKEININEEFKEIRKPKSKKEIINLIDDIKKSSKKSSKKEKHVIFKSIIIDISDDE